jgi:hypothetical protein
LKYFHWEIKEDTKIILGYSCQLAVTTLEEGPMIGFSLLPDAGPWKFGNTGYDFGDKSIDDYELGGIGIRIKNPILKYPKILFK